MVKMVVMITVAEIANGGVFLMARNKLTETKIKGLDKPGIYGDGDGLWLRVQRGGSRNWLFIYRRGPDRTEIGLGGYGRGTAPVSLALAREKAEAIRDQLARGEDPKRPKAKPATTFKECMDAVLAIKEQEWKSEKHGAQWRMTLREYAKPLHDKPVSDITVDDIVACLTPHWTERPETADRLRSRIGAVMDYAKARGLREGENPAAWRGNLKNLLPARRKLTRGHHAAMDYTALPAAIANLRTSSGTAARAVEFTVLTAARSGETRGAARNEFDLAEKVWTVPPERMKAGVEHRVPLTDRAVEIVQAQMQKSTSELVFEGGIEGKPISETAMTKALRLAANDQTVTLHGMRSTFRDWAGDTTSHPRDVCEAALSHTIQGVEAAYRRKDALEKRRALMEDWALYCGAEQK